MNEEKKIVIVTENEDQMLLLACMFLRHGKSNLELYSDCAFIREPQSIGWLLTDEKSVDFVPVISGSVIVLEQAVRDRNPGNCFWISVSRQNLSIRNFRNMSADR